MRTISIASSEPTNGEVDQIHKGSSTARSAHIEKSSTMNYEVPDRLDAVSGCEELKSDTDKVTGEPNEADGSKKTDMANKTVEDIKKPDAPSFPDDFLCPISLELMRDPVIVATGQVCFHFY